MTWSEALSVHQSRMLSAAQLHVLSHADPSCSYMESYDHNVHAVMVV